jgi:protein involved in polysaccharide export with SLBB domain
VPQFWLGRAENRVNPFMTFKRECGANLPNRTILFLWASMVVATMTSCSSGDQRPSERSRLSTPSAISAEQCDALSKIHEASTQDAGYLVQQGDQLAIEFYLNSEFNDNVTVDPEGEIALRLVGPLHAAGLTPDQLASKIDKAYKNELRNPGAVVHVHNMPGRQIYVEGEVSKPGAFPLQPGMTVVQAVALAGGTTDSSAPDNTLLIRRDACGQAQGSEVRLSKAVKNPGAGDDMALMSQDVVVVPRSKIADIDLFVKQYIKGVLPVEPYLNMPM